MAYEEQQYGGAMGSGVVSGAVGVYGVKVNAASDRVAIETAIDEVAAGRDRVGNALDRLEQRLVMLLQPVPPSPAVAGNLREIDRPMAPACGAMSKIASNLNEFAERIENMSRRLS